ncbi:hypothetical protein Gotur_003868, partial [Gossypium turneri]
MPPKLRDKGKGKIGESSKTQISSKPIKSWYEIFHEEENEKSSSSSKSSKNTIVQDAQDPNEIGSQIKTWIKSLSQSPEVALAFSQMKEESPLKQIAASDQTTTKFLQAKSTVSAMLAQAKTKKEYKNSWLKCSGHWILNSKMKNLQRLQSKRWILQM